MMATRAPPEYALKIRIFFHLCVIFDVFGGVFCSPLCFFFRRFSSFNTTSMISTSFFGHLTQDAKVAGADGAQFVSFTVAVNDGGDAYFLDCAYWSSSLLPYLKKGSAVFLMGKLRARPFIDGKGVPRPGLRCNVLAVRLAGATPRDGETSEPKTF